MNNNFINKNQDLNIPDYYKMIDQEKERREVN
jgi:hypothetical protein